MQVCRQASGEQEVIIGVSAGRLSARQACTEEGMYYRYTGSQRGSQGSSWDSGLSGLVSKHNQLHRGRRAPS